MSVPKARRGQGKLEVLTKAIELADYTRQICKAEKIFPKRIDTMEDRQDNFDKLVTSVEVLATKQETVETDVKEIKSDVKALAEKPAKRWDSQEISQINAIREEESMEKRAFV